MLLDTNFRRKLGHVVHFSSLTSGQDHELSLQMRELEARSRQLDLATRRIAALSCQDAVTGLATRRHFDEVLSRELERCMRQGVPATLALLELDQMRALREECGQVLADALLESVGGYLNRVIRAFDLAARYNPDQLIWFMPSVTVDRALEVAHRLRVGINQLSLPAGIEPLTASLGLAPVCTGLTSRELLCRAELALEAARANGRNRVELDPGPVCRESAPFYL